jgi:hypothetical protein
MAGIDTLKNFKGRPFHGVLSSANASGGVAVTLYKPGSTSTDSVGSDERLLITDYHLIAAAGGDCAIYAANSAAAQYTVARGTVGSNGGFGGVKTTPTFGKKAEGAFVVAPAGQVDVIIEGLIIKAGA